MKDWDEYFIGLTYQVADKSKDKSTHVGAIIVGPDNEIRSTGYNSQPRGAQDNLDERHLRPEKYLWFEHAERNAIYNAARMGTALKGCKIYLNYLPCPDCMRGVIQSGITEVIIHKNFPGAETITNWNDQFERSNVMAHECGVKIRFWDGELKEVKALYSGTSYNVYKE